MRIDVHAHYFPARYLDLLDRYGGSQSGTANARGTQADATPADLEARFGMMERAGIDRQVLSVSPQLPYFEQEANAVEAARLANDLYAELVVRHPDRFRAFVCTPLPHVEAALAELTRGLDELGMVGATIATSVLGRSIADDSFAPFWAELDRRRAVLFVHPAGVGAASPLMTGYGLTWPLGAPVEDAVAILHLLRAGIPARYPNVRIIVGHLGGVLPFLAARLDRQAGAFLPGGAEPPSVQVRGLWYDTVNNFVPSLHCACAAYGADRLLLGTDYPFLRGAEFQRAVTYIQESGLPEPDVAAILEGNAERLLGTA